jgi:hypothetical protein
MTTVRLLLLLLALTPVSGEVGFAPVSAVLPHHAQHNQDEPQDGHDDVCKKRMRNYQSLQWKVEKFTKVRNERWRN